MRLFPAIDLLGGQAVRLTRGDYNRVTVYSSRPEQVAADFERAGCHYLHLVDLDGAKSGHTVNMETIAAITQQTSLFVEVGGGIRNMQTAQAYLKAGVSRVILGTAAVTDEAFLSAALTRWGDKISVGVDILDGKVAIKGWTEQTALSCLDFCLRLEQLGVSHVICTDISKDGVMQGVNEELYRLLAANTKLNITASGGVSGLKDIIGLRRLDLYGAIIGKAYYQGAISLPEALEACK